MKLNQSWSHWSKGFVILLIALALAGCVQNTEDLRQTNLAAAGLEYNERISFTDDFDTCLGERVAITGVQHVVGQFTQDSNGRLHFGFKRNTRGTGIGQVTGNKYLLTDTVSITEFEVTPGEPKIFMQRYTEHLMRVSGNTPNDDAMLHFLTKITVDANGNVSSSIERERFECK